MQYRIFGKTNEKVSALGFGAMRLPIIDGQSNKIDEEKAIKMMRHAIDEGVNYIDTAYPYHGTGMASGGASEPFVAKVLEDGYREKVKIATKLPTWAIESKEDMYRILDDQLERLQTSQIDFYLLHGLTKDLWDKVFELGVLDFLNESLAAGKVKHVGFSFHDEYRVFKEIIDSYDKWSFTMIQYNYLDEYSQAGKEGIEYATEKGLGIAVMEPLRGGSLIANVPKEGEKLFKDYNSNKSNVAWAFEWLYDKPEISVVLSGMNTMEQVEENLEIAKRASAGMLNSEEKEIIKAVQDIYSEKQKVGCTGCNYCMPCPAGVNIPYVFDLYNKAHMLDNKERGTLAYTMLTVTSENAQADNCVSCGKCESHCPQHIEIIDQLKDVHTYFVG